MKNEVKAIMEKIKNARMLENLVNLDLESLVVRVKTDARLIELEREIKEKQKKKLNDLAYLFNTRMF
jgi:hypothetical protein